MSRPAVNAKLEAAIDRALDSESAEGSASETQRNDAAAVARVVTRFHGDNAAQVLKLAAEIAEASK